MLEKFKKKYVGTPEFYKRYIFLATPMIIQNAITNFVSFLDNIMVGQLGTEQMSGVAIVNQLLFVYYLAVFGVAGAASIFGAQFFGKGDHIGHMYTFRFRLYGTILVTALGICLFITNGDILISYFLTDVAGDGATDIALKYGLQYISVVMIGLVPFCFTNSYATAIKETGQTFIPMLAGLIAVGSNAILDYIMIFGVGPVPAMGVVGAAWATNISRFIEMGIVLVWAHSHKDVNRFLGGAYSGFGLPVDLLKKVLVKGAPLMANELLWAAGMTQLTQCYSVRGLEVIAALNISNTINNLFNIVFIQLGGCISIIVGQYLGAGELEEAKDADNKMIAFSVFCCTFMAILMFLVGGFFPNIYNTSDEIKDMARHFNTVLAIWMPFCSFSHCSYFTLRAGGKTIVTFLFDSVFTWVIMVPTATFFAKYTAIGIVMVYFIVNGTELIKNIVGYFMVKSNVWLERIV